MDDCEACKGIGYHERYYNEFDLYTFRCEVCDGSGSDELDGLEDLDE